MDEHEFEKKNMRRKFRIHQRIVGCFVQQKQTKCYSVRLFFKLYIFYTDNWYSNTCSPLQIHVPSPQNIQICVIMNPLKRHWRTENHQLKLFYFLMVETDAQYLLNRNVLFYMLLINIYLNAIVKMIWIQSFRSCIFTKKNLDHF